MGLNLDRLLKNYWKRQRIVPKARKCLGTVFGTGRGLTHDDLAPPTIFSIVVDELVWLVVDIFYIPQEAHLGMGWAPGEINLVLYAYGGMIDGRYNKWVQDALMAAVAVFHRIVLDANLKKTKTMVCGLGSIWGKREETVYKRRVMRERETFMER